MNPPRISRALPQIPPGTPLLEVSHPLSPTSSEALDSPNQQRPNSAASTSEFVPLDEAQPYPPSSRFSDSIPEFLEVPPTRSPSPAIIAASEHTAFTVSPPTAAAYGTATKTELLTVMIRHTAAWVLGGMGLMIAGIGLVQGVILPRIFTCPSGADCPMSFDPNKTSVLTYLQTLMQYMLVGGMLVASIGLLQLSAYQAWFIMMRDGGNTMGNLDLTLGAIRGSLIDAMRLAFRRGNRRLSAYVLSLLSIGTAISLIVSFSIARGKGTRLLTFTYPGNTQFPNSDLGHINSAGQLNAIAKVNAWALGNDTTHAHAYRGTLVTPDVRKIAIGAKAAGYIIKGTMSCAGYDNYTTTTRSGKVVQYDIHLGGQKYLVLPSMRMSVSMTSARTVAATNYIWASNIKGRLLNATETSDGVMYFTYCRQKMHLAKIAAAKKGVQQLTPTTPKIFGCSDDNQNVCVADAVNKAIISWWGGLGTSMWGMNCRGGVIGPLPRLLGAKDENCTFTEKVWSETAVSMLDAIVQTGVKTVNTSQKLVVPVETLNSRRWWLQALVPFLALVLYGVGLYYTLVLSQGRNVLKKLNLAEVIGAAQTDHVRDLLDSGNLKKTPMRYGSETGFIIPNHSVRTSDDERV